MNAGWIATVRDKWFAAGVGVTAVVAIAGGIVGFAWLPLAQPGVQFSGIWDAICSAAGLVQLAPSGEPVIQPDHPTTRVEVTPQMLAGASTQQIGHGATLAARCAMCHGARDLSQSEIPNLAGQFPVVVYKQLADFKTGARASPMMTPFVAGLSDADMRDLAVYYASLPRGSDNRAAAGEPPRIVANGAPMRGIAPCGACHGELGRQAGAAWLEGQPTAYLRGQLQAFASATRRNDIGEQMRNVARRMTSDEIDAASRYYAGRP